jgi:hypothetical protein
MQCWQEARKNPAARAEPDGGVGWFGLVWFGLVWFGLVWFDLPAGD